MKISCLYTAPFGELLLSQEDGALTELFFPEGFPSSPPPLGDSPLLRRARKELSEYFSGDRTCFSLPLCPLGTAFQRCVWQALTQIPYGETRSYGELAAAVGNPKASRAVGMANHRNPLPIFIPCHRVVGKNGSLTGFGGGLPIKRFLLELEGAWGKGLGEQGIPPSKH